MFFTVLFFFNYSAYIKINFYECLEEFDNIYLIFTQYHTGFCCLSVVAVFLNSKQKINQFFLIQLTKSLFKIFSNFVFTYVMVYSKVKWYCIKSIYDFWTLFKRTSFFLSKFSVKQHQYKKSLDNLTRSIHNLMLSSH